MFIWVRVRAGPGPKCEIHIGGDAGVGMTTLLLSVPLFQGATSNDIGLRDLRFDEGN
jgi:hypothetical protein